MIYTLQITCETDKEMPAVLHRPVSIETTAINEDEISPQELEAVAEFFKQQVSALLAQSAGKE